MASARLVAACCVVIGTSLFAAQGRGGAVVSPEIAADGRVTFRLRAPNAREVAVTGLGASQPMQKNEQGVWSLTTDALKPDIYTYRFNVDGVAMNDPGNPHVKTTFGNAGTSLLRVPGGNVWDPADGPKGAVTRHFYKSGVIGDDREYNVYTPPNYDRSRREAYPVLYLLHGLTDDAYSWISVGAANVILDNLIKQGKARPMIMVNTLGYGTTDAQGRTTLTGPEQMPNFTKALLTEVIPQVERSYNASKNRTDRAIAGLSMGGAEAVYVGLHHPEVFAWTASFSGAFMMWESVRGVEGGRARLDAAAFNKEFPQVSAKMNAQLKMLWIACGTSDGLIGANRAFRDWLRLKNVAFTEAEFPNVGHVWPLWRQNLAEIAPRLFR